MEALGHVALMIYALLGVGVVAFCVWIGPAVALEASDYILARVPAGWTVILENMFYSFMRELNEHLHFVDQEQSRHRRQDREQLFTEMVSELRLVKEGRRTPVSIRG